MGRPKTRTTENFIEDCRKVHGDRFDYSLTKYESAETPVTIICKEHGAFLQKPYWHVMGQAGCKECRVDNTKLTNKTFLEKANKVHFGFYKYPDLHFSNSQDTIKIVCPVHGEFEQQVKVHVRGSGCPQCGIAKRAKGKTLTTEEFLKRAKEIHGDRYDYSESVYTRKKDKLKIICPRHGAFYQTADGHLVGKGCVECTHINWGTETYFKKNPQMVNHPSVLYIALIEDKDEKFIKVGHTKKSFERRFNGKNMMGYAIEPVFQHFSGLLDCVTMENKIHKLFKDHSHKPKRRFCGRTECYSYDQLGTIMEFIKEEAA